MSDVTVDDLEPGDVVEITYLGHGTYYKIIDQVLEDKVRWARYDHKYPIIGKMGKSAKSHPEAENYMLRVVGSTYDSRLKRWLYNLIPFGRPWREKDDG